MCALFNHELPTGPIHFKFDVQFLVDVQVWFESGNLGLFFSDELNLPGVQLNY